MSTTPLAWLFADPDAVEEVRTLAADAGLRIEHFKEVAEAVRRYAHAQPALLLFAYLDLGQAERAFLELYRTAPGFAGGDHPSILLCKGQDADTAYALVKRRVFDDYVVFRPLYDPHRLAISIRHQLGERQREERVAVGHKLLDGTQRSAAMLHDALMRHAEVAATTAAELAAARRRLAAEAPELHPQLEAACAPVERRLATSSAAAQETAATVAPKLAEAGDWLARQPQRLAVVDDDPVYLQVLTRMLEQAGYEVAAFSDPIGALVALPRLKPDALLADVEMPGMSGLELIEQVHQVPALRELPCLLISGHADAQTVREAARRGIAGFIVKPGNRVTVLEKLRAVLPPRPPAGSLP